MLGIKFARIGLLFLMIGFFSFIHAGCQEPKRGPPGATGAIGPNGLQGQSGPIGPSGSGAPGTTGPTGLQGITGAAGPTGLQGITGFTGLPGVTGPTGLAGPPGATGSTGAPGLGCIEPRPTATQVVYVNKAGNDAIADGSQCFPFLTVTAAMASITDAIAPFPDPNNLTKRYAISIGPGQYVEALIHLKANVQLVGASALLTRLQIPFDINDPSWFDLNFSADPQSGFVNLSLLSSPLDFNFQAASSVSGKLFFVDVNITPSPIFTVLSTSFNQVNIHPTVQEGLDQLADDVAYTPANPADWNTQPTTVQEALDFIAAALGPI